MSEIDLLLQLRALGVRLWIEGDALKFSAPKGALTPELRDELKARKEEIKSFLLQAARAAGDGQRAPIAPVSRDGELPLSFGQERLWFLEQLEPGSASYVIPAAMRLEGPLDVAALGRAIGEIVRRHEALRTTFSSVEGRPVPIVHPPAEVPLPLVDLSALPVAEREEAVRRELSADSRRAFDLAAGPLLRARLLRLGPEEHVLSSAMHHIVSDGWSSNVFLRELSALYDAFAAGKPSPLPELAVQYADYAAWQRKILSGEALDRQLAYWKQRLAGAPSAIDLPTDRPRPPAMSQRGAWRGFTLSPELSEALRELSQREGATLFMTLLAALDVLLARSTGQDDLVIGTPIAGRARSETEPLIGFFVNTLVLRTTLSDDVSFRTLLARVKETCLGAYDHQDLPFERLVAELSPERDPSRSPLFQVMFVLQSQGREGGAPSGLKRRGVSVESGTAKFDLTLGMVDSPRGLHGVLEYASDLFDAATVDRMLEHFRTLLEAIVAAPDRAVGELPLLSAAERHSVLVELNDTSAVYPEDRLIHELFEAAVDRTPDAVAVVFEGRSLTYRELDARANQLAHALRRRGVGPDVIVGVCMERSLELLIALYGILKAGGAYVPLDPEYPKDRLGFMLEDTRVPVLLTQAHLEGVLPEHAAEVLRLDTGWDAVAAEPDTRPGRGALGLQHLAYVIYTSGSTGRPKGAMNEHRGILNRLAWMQDAHRLTSNDRVLQKTPFSFDVSVWELFWPLMFGARMVVAKPGGHRDPAYLTELIAAEGATTMHFVPSMLAVFLDELDRPGARERCQSLRRVFASGEALLPATVDAFFARLPQTELHNLYGPTEAAVDVTAWACAPGAAVVPIGKPIKNVRIYLLDERRQPVPFGVRGELYIGGVQVARGYLNRDALTAERFVADPFVPGGKLYRTGDVARHRADGAIEYLGRVDHQVKIRGFRIELGEIEAAIAAHHAAGEVVVVAREDTPGNKQLVAYLAAAPGAAPPVAELRAMLKARLPEYMVPSAFVLLERLPLTQSGKIDRKALPAPERAAPGDRAFVGPRGPVESALAAIFAEVLKLEKVGAHDGFFELGGHSLLATRVIARIRAAFAVDLPLRSLFEATTPAELAARVEAALRAGHGVSAPPMTRAPRDKSLVLSFAQERLWFLDQLEPGDPSYVVPLPMRLQGALDVSALGRALVEIVRRHEVLRTTFAVVAGQPVQVIHDVSDVPLPFTSLTSLPMAEREATVRREIAAEAGLPFDLSSGPLLRARLFAVGDDDHVLCLALHHIVSDAWTLGILNREISVLYRALSAGTPAELPELPIQYADFAAWQRGWLSGDVLDQQLAYWRERLAGAPASLDLPTDRPRPALPTHRGDRRAVAISPDVARPLAELARREGVTLFMLLLAAFDVLLHRYTGETDVVVGTPIAGRTQAETEGLIGFFVNTLVLRATLDPETSFRELLPRVREACLGAYAHQDMPFERLVQELAPDRDLARTPLFQVVFVLQNAAAEGLALEGVRRKGLAVETTTAKFDLTLVMAETAGGGLFASAEFATDLFDAATITRMLGHFTVLLEEIARDPSRPLWQLPLLPQAERQTLLGPWRGVATEYPRDAGIAAVFEAQVDETPDAVAVVYRDESLTYRELDVRANRLAHALRAAGVGPDVCVGLQAHRSLDMVVATLGILKAGGAYVPIDPDYPAQRIAWMLDDASIGIVVTAGAVRDEPLFAGRIRLDAAMSSGPADRLAPAAFAEHLAYVMYTSGSTGTPKGVAVLQRGVVRLVKSTSYARFAPDEIFLQFAPIAFDAATFEIWGALLNGGKLVVFPGDLPDLAELSRVIERHGVTTLWLTSGLFNAMVEGNAAGLRSLRRVLTGGDALSVPHVQRALAELPGVEIINGYGPTESTTFTTCQLIVSPDIVGSVPIGRPIANTFIYVLDDHRQLAPSGVPGELYIGGDGVARGYLGRPELTAERFVPDPFGADPTAKLYKTGDIVRFLPDGKLSFVGRRDFQVKLRGFRIELGEIEAALAQHPSVREVIVLARQDSPGDKRLVAYVVSAETTPSAAALEEFLGDRLPDYMVPSAFVFLAAMPLNPNGKVDRKALPAPDAAVSEERTYVAPRGPIEEAIAGIFAETLKLEQVGAHDGFFELGGHSLLATTAAGRLRAALGVDLPLRALFEAPTPAALARLVEAALAGDHGALPPPLVPAPRGGRLPLSFAEERLWFLDQLQPGDASYVVPLPVHLAGRLDEDALRRALTEIVRRHEILRTSFAIAEGQPVAVIHPSTAVDLPITSLTSLPFEERAPQARAEIAAESARPFNLARGPLFRARLLTLGDEDHVLCLAMHHVITDGWSLGILDREIASLYAAFSRGEASPLAELPIQYTDYAAWQRAWLSGDVLERQLAYWKQQLEGAPRAIELPTDRPRPPVQTYRGARQGFNVPEDVARALVELARREGATLFMILLAAFDVLLHRVTGQDDLLVGTPIANRTRAETEGLIGFFVNTLVMRARLSGQLSFRELVRQVREASLGAYAHQEMPFERLVQELEPERDPSRSPLFQVMFVLQNTPRSSGALAGVRRRELSTATVTAKFDLLLAMIETGSGLAGSIEYNVDLFDAPGIERMSAHLVTLLGGVAADPDRSIADLPILPEAERRTLLEDWRGAATDYPRDATIAAVFEAQADETPDAVAVAYRDQQLTYRELDTLGSRLAHVLRAQGVGPEVRVGLFARRSIEMIVGTLGILKAGGAYVPIDPEYPPERIAWMLEDASIRVVVTAGASRDDEALLGGKVRLDVAASIASGPSDRLAPGASAESLAYVMYTSGSTGTPKGIEVLQRGVVRLVKGTDYTRFAPDEIFLQFAPIAFDAATFEIWGALLNGGKLVIFPGDLPDLAELGGVIERHGVTTLWLTSGLFNAMVEGNIAGLRSLRRVLTGGDALSVPHVQRALAELPGVEIINGYGPTESTTFTTCHRVAAPDIVGSVPIGRPIANTFVYVLDAYRRLAPIGVPGELYIGGDGVARGYLGRPELTAERFVPDPFGDPRGKLYRTGDVVRFLPGGALSFVGRRDFQVKLRGFRIELGEIEIRLAQHPSVREVVVLARQDSPGDKRLVAYVVAAGEVPPASALAEFLGGKLPDYMVPSAFVFLAAMPLNPSGKVDRKALPAPDAAVSEAREHVAPRGPIEEAVAGIFAEVLRLDRVSARDGFFELGGHSLLATQAVARIRGALGVELPLRALFEAPTAAELGAEIELALRSERGAPPPPLVRVPRDEATRLSFGQERLWFLAQLEPGDPSYLVPQALRFEGALDLGALERAIAEVVCRHEILRTTFTAVDGRPVPVVHEAGALALPVQTFEDLPAAERAAVVRREAAAELDRPIDLAIGPVLRARVLALAPGDHALILTVHHIAFDGWSVGVLNREVSALYEAFLEGRPSPLPELPIQYADHAFWQRRWFEGGAQDPQLAYWRARLAGAPRALELPTDRPRPPVQTHRGASIVFTLPPELGEALKSVARKEGATLFMTLLAAFDVLMHRYSGQSDILVGTPIAGRTRVETERLVGFFLNTLVIRAELDDELTFSGLVARVKESCLGAYAHQDLPFERIVQEVSPERDLSRSPLFQVMLILQNASSGGLELEGTKLRSSPIESATAKFDLTLGMSEQRGGGLSGTLEYATDLFDRASIERMIESFRVLLQGIAARPASRLWELPILSEAERTRLVVDWNRTEAEFPSEATVHQLFAEQAARTPGAPAVALGDEVLSYRQLDERANQLAHFLRKRGVGPEVLVGICARRSIPMVVAILGVLKAGGAYVPMDPEYPRDRLAYMIEDAGAPVLLTEAALAGTVPPGRAEVVLLDSGWETIAGEPITAPESGAGPENLAYVIYTSGSTGRPKGTMLVHRGVVNYLWWANRAYRVAEGEGAPLHSSIGFDLTVTSLFTPLTTGRKVTLVAEGQGIEALATALRGAADQSLVKITPAHLEVLSQQLTPAEAAGKTRSFIIGGEALMGKVVSFWQQHAPATRLINEYGPTETVVGCCIYEARADEVFPGPVPIGRPIANMQLYVLDRHLSPVPVGVVGEVYIGGVGVGRGYLHRPELTAERFIADPFRADPFNDGGSPGKPGSSPKPPARLYRAGDLARHLGSGELEYLGRIDHQVKIRGYRIELGEIEAVLGRHPAVREAAVLAREDVPGQKRLVAYLVCEPAEGAAPPTVGDLRAFLKEQLPEYMVPAAFVLLGAMPLTQNGKVDRAALPAPDQGERAELGESFVEARNAVEEELVRIWKSVLRLKQIGVHDNFFAIGGDSILSIQIVSRAQQAGLSLTPRHLFLHQTIAELSEVAGAARVAVDAEQGAVVGPVIATPIQRWWADLAPEGAHHWNQAFLLEVREPLDPAALEQAVNALVEHHDMLRLRATPALSIAAPGEPTPYRRIDLGGVPDALVKGAIEAAVADAQASLDLANGPVVRVLHLELGPGRPARLFLGIHHLAVDGVSWRILFEDLWSAYASARLGQPIALPRKTTSFPRWAEKLTAHAQGDALGTELDHWLSPARRRAARLPIDHDRGDNDEASARTVVALLGAEDTERLLREVPEVYRTQINDVLLTAFALAFERWTESPTVLLELEGHGREELFEDVDLTRTVGWFTTLFPVVLELGRGMPTGEAIKSVKEQLRAVPGRGIGYGLLRYLREGDAAAELRALPAAEVSFNYLGQFGDVASGGGSGEGRAAAPTRPARESSGPSRSPRARRTHLLELNASVNAGRLDVRWTYSDNRHLKATIEALAGYFLDALRDIIAHCLSPEAGGATPSDFQKANLSQDMIDMLAGFDPGEGDDEDDELAD